jgi:hypothetical protein
MMGFCCQVPIEPRKIMQRVQDPHMRCYRLHLRFVALCQAISLEPPYYTKIEFQGHPHQLYCSDSNGILVLSICASHSTDSIDGGGGGSRTLVFPPLLLIVNN